MQCIYIYMPWDSHTRAEINKYSVVHQSNTAYFSVSLSNVIIYELQ